MSDAVDSRVTEPERPARLSFWRIAVLLMFFACLPTVAALGARWFWVLDLATHFRVQYACAMLPFLVLFAARRRFRLALVPAVVLLVNLSLFLPIYWPAARPPADAGTLRAITANVHTGNRRFDAFLQFIRSERPDFFVAFEIDDRWAATLDSLKAEYPHTIVEPRPDNFGIGLYSRLPIRQSRIVALADSEVPTVIAELASEVGEFTVIGTHPLPPTSAAYSGYRNRHLRALAESAARTSGPLIVLGDLNVTPWSPHFRDVLARSGLRDSRQGFGIQPTWPEQSPALLIPIDHALVSPEVAVINRRVGPDIGSDHRPVVLDFGLARRP